jgi:hypothetical protein
MNSRFAFLLGCIFGYPGVEIGMGEPAEWCTRPVTTPRGWDAIEIDRIWVRDRPARLSARNGSPSARIAWLD